MYFSPFVTFFLVSLDFTLLHSSIFPFPESVAIGDGESRCMHETPPFGELEHAWLKVDSFLFLVASIT